MKKILKIRISVGTLAAQSKALIKGPYWAFHEIRDRFGKYVDNKTQIFNYEGDPASDETGRIVNFVESLGVSLIWNKYPFLPESEGIQVEGRREFEESDFRGAEHFVMLPQKEIAETSGEVDTNGILEFLSSKRAPIGSALFGGVYCHDAIRQEIVRLKVLGAVFRAPNCKCEQIFELRSNIFMPKVLNKVVDEVTGKESHDRIACGIQDIFLPHVPLFLSEEIPRDFDVAETIETWHWSHKPHAARPWLVVSRRLRDWCIKREFDIEWVPVEVCHEAFDHNSRRC